MITGIRSEQVPKIWPAVSPQIKRVTDKFDAGYDESRVYERLLSGDQQLWVAMDDDIQGVIITEILVLPHFKILSVPIIAGESMNSWLGDLVALMVEFGKYHHCKYIEGYGRKGWIKQLADHGFDHYSVTVRREL